MPSPANPAIHVTVAAVAERDGRFLLVEERVGNRLVLNQPAGHLEPDESLLEAVIRETLEETGWHFRPQALVGLYQWRVPETGHVYLRHAFCGILTGVATDRPLDDDIHRVVWRDRATLVQEPGRLRSPLVLAAIDDYLSGRRYDLELLRPG